MRHSGVNTRGTLMSCHRNHSSNANIIICTKLCRSGLSRVLGQMWSRMCIPPKQTDRTEERERKMEPCLHHAAPSGTRESNQTPPDVAQGQAGTGLRRLRWVQCAQLNTWERCNEPGVANSPIPKTRQHNCSSLRKQSQGRTLRISRRRALIEGRERARAAWSTMFPSFSLETRSSSLWLTLVSFRTGARHTRIETGLLSIRKFFTPALSVRT